MSFTGVVLMSEKKFNLTCVVYKQICLEEIILGGGQR